MVCNQGHPRQRYCNAFVNTSAKPGSSHKAMKGKSRERMATELTLNRRSRKGCVAIATPIPSIPPHRIFGQTGTDCRRLRLSHFRSTTAKPRFPSAPMPLPSKADGRSTLDDDRTDTKRTTPNGHSSRLPSPYCKCQWQPC